MIEVYGHGGDLETAAYTYGRRAGDFTDFSSNINPLGPQPGLMEGLTEALSTISRYPDPGHRQFKGALAEKLGLGESYLSIGNGAAETMALILLALQPGTVGIVEPCFSEYRALAEQFGSKVISVRGQAENNFHADPRDMEQLIRRSDLVFLGQPNNPNGVQYGIELLRQYARFAEQEGTFLVVDEAFIDFIVPESRHSLLNEISLYSRVILVRSMTKFYAIPGLRLGYGIAHPDIIRAMTNKQVTWSVNQLALVAGQICMAAPPSYEASTISLITEERRRLREGLGRLGCRTWAGEANFLLVRLPDGWTASQMQNELGQRGVLIRSCAMYPGLGEGDIRVAVKNMKDNSLLLREMQAVIGNGQQ
ncbi:pyridoxal phosphate-dependent class II aminotransferase [Paenibacillus zeisoli]|uniref:Aminotransferase n=1 Tax=Paenibacillus zeisoli TaxID=2496267 RepID=A0A433X2W3_9BACL|nr:aminotransferase class I/II-fold pyridoxal phosphate-dependent enzyme [Paenibacillus zeisoli]RUT28408.1 pyridoxal phosphate-dependent class II aminotransferase [Paenibacillus zeisoli]